MRERERHHHTVVDNRSGSVVYMYSHDEMGLRKAREHVRRYGKASIKDVHEGAEYEDILNGTRVHGTESIGGIRTDNLRHGRGTF